MCIVSLWLQVLFKAGEEKFGTDEQTFVTILGNRSAEHLRKGLYAVSELQRGQNHVQVQFDVTGLDLFQCLMHTWRWLGMRWRRALREKHLEVWRTSCWPWVRMDACFFFLIVRPLTRYNDFFPILKWSVPGAFQLILLRPCTTQWRWRAISFFFLQRYLVWS